MNRRFALLAVLALLTGCVQRFSTVMDSWIGRTESDLVIALGAPNRTADLPDGRKVLTWSKIYDGEDGGIATCTRSYVILAAKVERWSTSGCPSIVMK